MSKNEGIFICDTTLREGGQSMGSSFTVQDMLIIATKLFEFGIPWIEGPWPVPFEEAAKDDDVAKARQKAVEFYELASHSAFRERLVVFGSTIKKDEDAKNSERIKAMLATGFKNFAIFGKTWKRHIAEVLKTTLKENLRLIEETVRYLKKQQGFVFYDAEHFFNAFLDDPNYALQTLDTAIGAGADALILCDTNGGMLPDQVTEILVRALPVLSQTAWGVHMHDDGDLALANTLVAIKNGATYAQCTVNGESERVGMPKLTSLLPTLIHKQGLPCHGIDSIRGLKALAQLVAERNNTVLASNQAYVGDWAFAHKAGTHQAGVREDPSLQEHIDPDLIGAKRRMPISGEAGRKAIAEVLKKELNLELGPDDQLVQKMLSEVKRLDRKGFHLESSQGTFLLIALQQLEKYQPPFEIKVIKPASTLVWDNGSFKKHRSEAALEISFPGEIETQRIWARAEDGPVDAINQALKPALSRVYPIIKQVELFDFKVRILKANGKGTASRVRVSIVGKTPLGFLETAGISRNILLASAEALLDLYELVILKSQLIK